MPKITLLDQETIDKIAAGEVVERPSSVVKELVENAIDAKATAVTVEIKEGGISFIRITDNGFGIERSQVPVAFLRHSTSKIKSAEDLFSIHSLGFRGEALSSIAAIAQVELITKTYGDLTGTRYVIEGSKEKENEEIGAPEGTTFIVRNLFYNTPARRKFLKTPQTEGNYISDLMERLALSHPNVSFKFISNGQTKLHTSGNSNEKDMIYHIYGRDIAAALLPIEVEGDIFQVHGFIGKPLVSRGNRNLENYFINGRYIKSALFAKAIEEAYKGFLMQHQYPFCVLYFTMDSELLDVNVHPNKMELRFSHNEEIYEQLYQVIRNALTHKEHIVKVPIDEKKEEKRQFPDSKLLENKLKGIPKNTENEPENEQAFKNLIKKRETPAGVAEKIEYQVKKPEEQPKQQETKVRQKPQETIEPETSQTKEYEQQELSSAETGFLTKDARKKHRIIGSLFDTYWLIEYEDNLFIIDQHAAHEKVLFEKTMARVKKNKFTSQSVSPPIVISLSADEEEMLVRYKEQIAAFGYDIEHFGGKEYALNAIPAEFENIDRKQMFLELLDDFANLNGREEPEMILEKVASMSCKAAVKGRQRLSLPEIEHLIEELLGLDNPYHCPHGRPTIIAMSRYEIEKKFKRIV